jgi:hypothetical protein
MVTKSQHRMSDKPTVDSIPLSDNANSENKTTQDYKKILRKRLYELESESMPAT